MDYIVDNNTVTPGLGDTPPTTGTPGEATNGSPIGPIPRSIFPAWAWNMILGACRNVIVAAGLTPNRADRTLLLQAIKIVPPGRLLNVQKFTAAGIQTYSPTPGTKSARARVIGGGGAGGGAPAVTGSNISLGSGGTAGSDTIGWATITGPVTVTVGNGGAAQTGGGGFPGGSSSFGTLLSAPGGPGGQIAGPTALGAAIGGANGSLGVGGDQNGDGAPGGISLAITANTGYGGAGGASILGGGGAAVSQNITGLAAKAAGSGGGGTCATTGNGALAGGAGATGLVIVEEYS